MLKSIYQHKYFYLVLVSQVTLLLSACQPAVSGSGTPSKPADTVEVSVDAVNYMHDHSVQFTLRDASNTPVGGAIVDILVGPGGKNCCTSLPAQWRPGLKYTLSWQEADSEKILPTKYEKVIELPRYSAPGDVYVLFYPNQEVELIASPVEPGHADWAGKIKTNPLTACAARLSEKECRKYLPKYKWGTADYAAAQMREGCQEAKIVYSKDPEIIKLNRDACASMQKECLATWAVTDKEMCSPSYKEQ